MATLSILQLLMRCLLPGTVAESVLIDQDRKLAEGQGYDLRDAEVSAVISLLVAPQM